MLGLLDNYPRLRRLSRTIGIGFFVLGIAGFGFRVAQQAGVVSVNLDPDRKVQECAILEKALVAERLAPIDFVTAGCPSVRVREVLVQRVQVQN
ncbi:hypothetical protein [Azospirillum sp. SYSU D00513]|uniref:hypothetical protein n=1 Tax=Azospirillum sp. SYSU D00513 TaxID=2812561 RepID=UPI001A95B120|nr:hypothetical protein [Azospirillum sp. SYSU D00513]